MIIDNRYLDIPEIARLCHKSAEWVRYRIKHDENFPPNVTLENHPTVKNKPKELFALEEIRAYLDAHLTRKDHKPVKKGFRQPKPEPPPRVKTFVSWVLGTEKRPACQPITQPFRRHVRVAGWNSGD